MDNTCHFSLIIKLMNPYNSLQFLHNDLNSDNLLRARRQRRIYHEILLAPGNFNSPLQNCEQLDVANNRTSYEADAI